MAMDRLPGHASGSLRTTEQRMPCRSTTADHIRLGLNKPPLASARFTTVASFACRFFTMPSGMLQSSSARAGVESSSPAAAMIRLFVNRNACRMAYPKNACAKKHGHPPQRGCKKRGYESEVTKDRAIYLRLVKTEKKTTVAEMNACR